MSINWVMLDAQDFVRLPGEKPVYKSPARTALTLTTPKSYPANSNFVSMASDSGIVYLTNQRVVYIPNKRTDHFQSFSAPLLKLHDAHITVPWFGPNAWQSLVEPVPGGNLPASSTGIELKLTFKEGGATDFHSAFERIKERLQQAVEAARDGGQAQSRPDGFVNGINMNTVHLDQLPSYEASGHDRIASPDAAAIPAVVAAPVQPVATALQTPATEQETQSEDTEQPSDAPPGYEETQQRSVQQELDRRLSQT